MKATAKEYTERRKGQRKPKPANANKIIKGYRYYRRKMKEIMMSD